MIAELVALGAAVVLTQIQDWRTGTTYSQREKADRMREKARRAQEYARQRRKRTHSPR